MISEVKIAERLRPNINTALFHSQKQWWDQEVNVRDHLTEALKEIGSFHRRPDGTPVFLRESDGQPYAITSGAESDFGLLVMYLTGLSVRNGLMQRVVDTLRAEIIFDPGAVLPGSGS